LKLKIPFVLENRKENGVPGTIYDGLGEGYALRRRPDSRIASAIVSALSDARTVVNVGAGTGSYDRVPGRGVAAALWSPRSPA
jgi:hypothetical protein